MLVVGASHFARGADADVAGLDLGNQGWRRVLLDVTRTLHRARADVEHLGRFGRSWQVPQICGTSRVLVSPGLQLGDLRRHHGALALVQMAALQVQANDEGQRVGAGYGLQGVPDLSGLMDFLAGETKVSSGRDRKGVLIGNGFSTLAIPAYFARRLRLVIGVGEPLLAQRRDLDGVRLSAASAT